MLHKRFCVLSRNSRVYIVVRDDGDNVTLFGITADRRKSKRIMHRAIRAHRRNTWREQPGMLFDTIQAKSLV